MTVTKSVGETILVQVTGVGGPVAKGTRVGTTSDNQAVVANGASSVAPLDQATATFGGQVNIVGPGTANLTTDILAPNGLHVQKTNTAIITPSGGSATDFVVTLI